MCSLAAAGSTTDPATCAFAAAAASAAAQQFLLIGGVGIANLAHYGGEVLSAWSPHWMVLFWVRFFPALCMVQWHNT
jgi:hypothetical protein